MTARVRLRGTTSSESSAWVPMSTSTSPAAKRSTIAARSAAAVEPVSRATRTPAPSKRSPRPSMCWRASTSVGARSMACPSESAAAARAWPATTVLPVPTSPRSIWLATVGAARAERISSRARCCSPVSSKGSEEAKAASRGPSTTWAWGTHPALRAAPSCMRNSSKYSSLVDESPPRLVGLGHRARKRMAQRGVPAHEPIGAGAAPEAAGRKPSAASQSVGHDVAHPGVAA